MNAAGQINLFLPQLVSRRRVRSGIGLGDLAGLGASIPIQLSVDQPVMQVGKEARFRIVGAPPNATIYWSSYKNGQSTGELNASYNQRTEQNGTAELPYTPSAEQVGNWSKSVLIIDGEGKNYTAMVQYQVREAASIPTGNDTPLPAPSSGFLDTLLNEGFYLGSTFIPYVLIAGGLGVFIFLKKK